MAVVPPASILPGGVGARLLTAWGPSPSATLILCTGVGCDPGSLSSAVRTAHPALAMRVVECEVGGSPGAEELVGLLGVVGGAGGAPPRQVVVAEADAAAVAALPPALRWAGVLCVCVCV